MLAHDVLHARALELVQHLRVSVLHRAQQCTGRCLVISNAASHDPMLEGPEFGLRTVDVMAQPLH
jgi:hypothetical protein